MIDKKCLRDVKPGDIELIGDTLILYIKVKHRDDNEYSIDVQYIAFYKNKAPITTKSCWLSSQSCNIIC